MKKLSMRSRFVLASTAVVAFASNASAALTVPTIDTADFTAVAGAVIVALGVMWAIKKALSLLK